MASQASRIGDSLRKHVATAAKSLALEIDRQLRLATPVDTGHARRNWIPSVGEPNATIAGDEGAHSQGISAVLSYELGKGALWVANVVPYIRRLNYGHSQQAPAGFVERAIDIALQTVKATDMHAQFRSEMGGDAAGNLASAFSPFGGSDE